MVGHFQLKLKMLLVSCCHKSDTEAVHSIVKHHCPSYGVQPSMNSCASLVSFDGCKSLLHGDMPKGCCGPDTGAYGCSQSVLLCPCACLKIPSCGLQAPPVRRCRLFERCSSHTCATLTYVIILQSPLNVVHLT